MRPNARHIHMMCMWREFGRANDGVRCMASRCHALNMAWRLRRSFLHTGDDRAMNDLALFSAERDLMRSLTGLEHVWVSHLIEARHV